MLLRVFRKKLDESFKITVCQYTSTKHFNLLNLFILVSFLDKSVSRESLSKSDSNVQLTDRPASVVYMNMTPQKKDKKGKHLLRLSLTSSYSDRHVFQKPLFWLDFQEYR